MIFTNFISSLATQGAGMRRTRSGKERERGL